MTKAENWQKISEIEARIVQARRNDGRADSLGKPTKDHEEYTVSLQKGPDGEPCLFVTGYIHRDHTSPDFNEGKLAVPALWQSPDLALAWDLLVNAMRSACMATPEEMAELQAAYDAGRDAKD